MLYLKRVQRLSFLSKNRGRHINITYKPSVPTTYNILNINYDENKHWMILLTH